MPPNQVILSAQLSNDAEFIFNQVVVFSFCAGAVRFLERHIAPICVENNELRLEAASAEN